ncbi:MAG: tetratricopeptide repeat protein [Akkermansiaceae bacterium]
MSKISKTCYLGLPCVFLSFQLPADAQPPLRAEAVEQDLRADPANTYFARGKNVFDAAKKSVDMQTRRELYLRAANIFSAYLNEFPRHANAEPAWWYLGSSYYQAGRVDEAKRCFSTLLNRYGRGKYAAAAAYTLAADHYNQREYAFAAPLFERFAANSARPEDRPKGNLFAAKCYQMLGRDREAIAAYKRTINDPKGGLFRDQATVAMGHLIFRQGKLEEALKIFEQVAASDAPAKYRGDAALHAAITATKLNRTELADKYLRFVLDRPGMDEFRPSAQIALMENLYAKKEYAKVLDIFRKSKTKAKGDKEAARLMIAARAMLKLKQPVDASELFREIERLVPPENDLAFQASYYRLNCFFQIEGRHVVDQVDAFLQIYGKSRPSDTRIHTAKLMKAETLFSENKIVEAAKVYSEIDPTLLSESNRSGFLYQRGWVLSEAGNAQGAIRSLSDFISKHPDDERIYPALVKRAKAYAEIGQAEQSIADFDRIALDEAAPDDLSSLAWLESARVMRKEGNVKNMLVRYRGLLDQVDDLTDNLKAEANYWIGWGNVKSNQPKDAAPYLNKARDLRSEAYGKHAGLLLALSYFAAQEPTKLGKEIDLAIEGKYVSDIPDQALQWAGIDAYNAENYEAANRFLKLASDEEEPRSTPKEVWRYLGKARIEIGEASEALPAIANLLDAEENAAWKADALLDRAKALLILDRFDESRKAADEALALRPQGRTSAGLRIVSADLHAEAGRLGEAAADLLYVIQFHEDDRLKPLAIHKYIQILEKQGKATEVAKYKAQLSSEFPDWKAP